MDQQKWLDRETWIEHLGLAPEDMSRIVNPFDGSSEFHEDPALFILRMMRRPEFFYFTCKQLLDIELAPYQCVLLMEMWNHPFPMVIGARGLGKSFLLGLYALLRALFIQGRKIVITGAGFRQAKTVFLYAENIWYNSPMLQSLVAENSRSGPSHDADRWVLRLGESEVIAVPVGDGTKVRGQRAHDLIADEFASLPWEIFETVFSGFAVVSLNPVKRAKDKARIRVMKKHGLWSDERQEQHRLMDVPNQTILSGTASYQFNHFFRYWKRWKGIIESKGDMGRLAVACEGEVDEKMDWRDYAIFRIPYDMIPEGYYDENQVAKSRGTIHSGIFQMEFGAIFTADSNGFFKRSLIETCVTNSPVIPNIEGSIPVQFDAVTRGSHANSYVFGIDPASESDSFAIVVLEVHDNHRRVVYCWTTDKERFNAKVKSGYVQEKDYYGYCGRKIRELMKVFPCEVIALDAQGGGVAVMETLHDDDKIKPGEHPLWPVTPDHVLSDGKEREIDVRHGLHIVELVQFAKADYVFEANHSLRKDLEDRVVLFPQINPVLLAVAAEEDAIKKRMFDTLEDCHDEIEELKTELTTIVHSQTPGTNRGKWDTPEVKLAGMKKGRLRKDRYSALLMANYAARRIHRQFEMPPAEAYGGFTDNLVLKEYGDEMYSFVPEWMKKAEGEFEHYGCV